MRRGDFTWKETIYEDVAIAEVPKVVVRLLVDRDPADLGPVKVEPEVDGTYTVSYRYFGGSKWDDDEFPQEYADNLCDTCPEAFEVNVRGVANAAHDAIKHMIKNMPEGCKEFGIIDDDMTVTVKIKHRNEEEKDEHNAQIQA